ncbi:MAG TPA: hypothetical protein VGE35_01405 [Candidatus Paceibacterota bacterium]
MNPRTTAILHFAFLAFAIGFAVWLFMPHAEVAQEPTDKATTTRVALFPEVNIEAKSAMVYDVTTGKVLYEKDGELQWPLASLTKIMSAYTAAQIVPHYMLVRITPDDLREEGDTGLRPDEEWTIDKLIDYSLIVSSNDGMRAIASVAGSQIGVSPTTTAQESFVRTMNENAVKLGMRESYFLNPSGLDVSDTLSGGYGSARDMVLLVKHVISVDPHLMEATSYGETVVASKNEAHGARNTNKAINNIPNVIASKTGFTDLSGGNVVIAFDASINHPVIISVLGSSYDGRFDDLTNLANATLSYLTNASTTEVAIPVAAR